MVISDWSSDGCSSDLPPPWTARGVFLSMQEAARRRLGAGLDGMTVAVQGLGNVGSALCALLHDAGARLIVAEPRPGVAAAVALRYGAEIMGRESILDARRSAKRRVGKGWVSTF